MTTHAALNKLVSNIDTTFNDFYIGTATKITYGPPPGLISSSSRAVTGPPKDFSGEEGFKGIYQDGENDQTHHFARYFRAGIRTENIKAAVHTAVFDRRNEKDQALSAAAYSLGESLKARQIGTRPERIDMGDRPPVTMQAPVYESPAARLQRVLGIARSVKSTICD